MHIVALIVGIVVAALIWNAGHPVWGVLADVFIASGVWLVIAALVGSSVRALTPSAQRDAREFRAALVANNARARWRRRERKSLRELWLERRAEAARLGRPLPANEYVRFVIDEFEQARAGEPTPPPPWE